MTLSPTPWLRCAVLLSAALAPTGAALADQWNPSNNPDRFGGTLVVQLGDLPLSGRADSPPWPSSFHPVYESDAPAPDAVTQAAALWLSLYGDGDSTSWDAIAAEVESCPVFASDGGQPAFAETAQAYSSESALVRDEQEDVGDDEFYFGLCHAWVAAAILEPEPKLSVELDGTTLSADELGALATIGYATTTARVVGSACSLDLGDDTLTIDEDGFIIDPSAYAQVGNGVSVDEDGFLVDPEFYAGDASVSVDEDGFIQEPECYDGNAGTFHALITNVVGLQGLSFAVDRSPFDALQFAPVVGYEQTILADLDQVELEGALDEVGWLLLDTRADSYAYVETTVTYLDPLTEDGLTKQLYAYVLELDAGGAITGGTWAAGNLSAAPDFFLLPIAGAAQLDGLGLDDLGSWIDLSADGDDDDVADALDSCPDDAGADLDADGDGCADSVSGLPALVISLGLSTGTANALLASAQAAAASSERGSASAAFNQLEAFVNKVQAQQGKKIDTDDATLLIAFATNAAAGLED